MLQQEKIRQAKAILQAENVDMWITIGRETVMNSEPVLPFLSTLQLGSNTAIIITNDTCICYAGHLDAYGMEQQGIYDEVISYDKSFKEGFLQLLKRFNPQQIALNYSGDVASDGLTHGMYLFLQEMFKAADYQGAIISSEKIINKLRGIKTPAELAAIKKAIACTEKILVEAADFIQEGRTQIEIHQFCQDRIKHYQQGNAWEIKHNPGVMLNNAPMGHAGPGDYRCHQGELVTLDFGVRVDEYCSDIQRVYYILKDDEQTAPLYYQEALANIQHAQDIGLALMRPHTPAYVPDEAARAAIKAFGYPDFNFGFGHQVGRETHDGGVMMGPRWERYLGRVEAEMEVGMVFTVDINIGFSDGWIGQEDMALIGP
ncbi:Methionine aminopeptidase [bioreactor metagenome]|uniref:Methionine aminopeptidase n=1 Tax=bioreactor metagenome TaxID=1076179 RepID=A0A645B4M8_9ZZZZ